MIDHTTLGTAAMVPGWGREAATRAFLDILDQVNGRSLAEIKG